MNARTLPQGRKVLALSGGVGGAKLALGLAKLLPPEQLTLVANTGDDFEHLGLSICPDLDTVMYTLAGVSNQALGWGLANETWNAMAALEELGGETWFRLGDNDLATHLERSQRLRQGHSLSQVTRYLCERFGVAHPLLPMTDDIVRTTVHTAEGELPFQHYFVRERCEPQVTGFSFAGADVAEPQGEFYATLQDPDLAAIIICPSNPFVSVEPVLQLGGVREAMRESAAPVIAVSPIVGGQALKGPAAKMLAELNLPATAKAVADYYGDLLDGFVIDEADRPLSESTTTHDVPWAVMPTVMTTLDDRVNLARQVVAFALALSE